MKLLLKMVRGLLLLLAACANAEVTFVHTDHLGSVVAESDASGAITKRFHYKPFGDTVEAQQDDAGYTGHKHDVDLGLTYMQARYYDPVLGRFYGNDPVGAVEYLETSIGMYGFNRYSYANNNSYRYIDPDGRTSWPVDKNKNNLVVVTSPFGPRNTGIPGASSKHSGTDFRAGQGVDIKATENGTVEKIGSSSNAGNYILISNDDGSMSGHAHTDAAQGLKVGDKVSEGSTIGVSDGSGTGNAPHQHYTYRIGTPSNPATQSTVTVDPMTTQFKNMPKNEICTKSRGNNC